MLQITSKMMNYSRFNQNWWQSMDIDNCVETSTNTWHIDTTLYVPIINLHFIPKRQPETCISYLPTLINYIN